MLTLFNNPIVFLGVFVAFLVAISVHEAAHAWTADRLGDPTAKLMGRLTLNPIPHIDLIGTIIFPLIMIISKIPFFVGWAKPVQFDPFNLRNPRRDGAIISIAGPAANMFTAIIFAVILSILNRTIFIHISTTYFGMLLEAFFQFLIIINVSLAMFNLVPVSPLDGFAVVEGILPEKYAKEWRTLRPYGFIILLFLVFPVFGGSSPVINIISPVISFILSILIPGAGVI